MNRESQRKLKFDSRLRGRLGWVSEQDLETELERLEDVSDNVADEESQEAERPRETEPSLPDQPLNKLV
ncbi:MAG: hypothetical protein VCC04_08245 [Myxococcota bacterium]